HFLVDPARSSRRGRADHDQVFRLRERLVDLAAKLGRAGQFLAVAEDRIQPARNAAVRGLLPDQPRGYAIRFQRLVQPVRPRFVAVAVADEGAVGDLGNVRIRHGAPRHDVEPRRRTRSSGAERWRVATIPYGRIAGPKLAPN